MGTDMMLAEDGEVMTATSSAILDVQARAEIDTLIATAKRFPRSIKRFLANSETLATLNPEIARQCTYAKPIGKNQVAVGPSVRLAEIMLSAWGNLSVGARVIAEDSRFLTAQAVCIDYETNVRTCIEVRRRITDKQGRTYSDDNIANAANAACSIALRNAVFRIIPKSLVEQVRLKAAEVANGGASVEQLREEWLAYWGALGIEAGRVFFLLGVAGKDDVTVDHIDLLRGLANAVSDRETTIEEAFPPVANAVNPRDAVSAAWDRHKQTKSEALGDQLKAAGGASEPPPGD